MRTTTTKAAVHMKGTWKDRTAAVRRGAMLVKKGVDVTEVCEALVQENFTNPAAMTDRQFNLLVADVTKKAAYFSFSKSVV